jgi:hypothetical protein
LIYFQDYVTKNPIHITWLTQHEWNAAKD